jgi:purine-nucleoside phosphorylase
MSKGVTMDTLMKLNKAVEYIRTITDFVPDIALVLGSGLNDFADILETEKEIEYRNIPGFPLSTVHGHDGKFVFGVLNGIRIVCMKGRVHHYEGYTMQDVVMPTRVMGLLGAKVLFLTNAAGGVNRNFTSGALMAIEDHIACLVPNPLVGPNLNSLGLRFPDMTFTYDRKLLAAMQQASTIAGVPLHQGIYVQFSGPSFETPAEISMARIWGGDAVGMSTAVEAIAGHHMGMRVCGISCITNMAAGITGEKLSHEEVNETASKVKNQFISLVQQAIIEIGKVI